MAVAFTSALDLSRALRAKELSAGEVMQATLDRIEAVNGAVNAVVSLRAREALLAEAKAADGQDSKGWLHGIPVAVKDLANATGVPTSMGSPVFAGQMADRDDLHIARMRAAGAIVIGKTNTPEFGLGSHTFNPVFGATTNPYDTSKTCGGSSGGAAVALATGISAVADGSDMMGSLRNPAAWNNVYGIRPSVGVVPSEPKGDTYLMHLATNGPMARNPSDLAALLDTMAGPDARQPFHLDIGATLPRIDADVAGRKIGWLSDWGGAVPFEPGILELCEDALRQMGELGLQVEALKPPCSAEALWEPWQGLRHYAIACGLGPLIENPTTKDRLKETARWEIENGLALSGADVHRLSSLRSAWFQTAAKLFQTYDVLALPTTQVWPFALDLEYPTEIAGTKMDTYHRWMEVVLPASLIGLPVVSVPVGFGANGLPMGMQLIGRQGADAQVLQVAQAWHRATDWPNARPPQIQS
ncbi:MAG: amidase [Paracoccaceae bacterium]